MASTHRRHKLGNQPRRHVCRLQLAPRPTKQIAPRKAELAARSSVGVFDTAAEIHNHDR
jgi:hypothetical protein